MRQRLARPTVALLGMAMLFTVLPAAVYRSFVSSDFSPIRITVINEEQTASRRIVTITLPNLSGLRGQTAVLDFQLRNRGTEPRRIGLSGDGLPATRVVVPPNRPISWDVVLSPEIVQRLQARPDGAARSLELTADADVWDLMAFEIRNYHWRWGDRLVMVVPDHADGHIAGRWFLPVAAALCALALLTVLAWSMPQDRLLRRIANALTFTALALCLGCLTLTRFSRYQMLLSPSAFLLVAAILFARVPLYLFQKAPTSVATMRSIGATVARAWQRHELTLERGAALLGLAAIAVAQPIFEVVSNSPEFFPARSTPPATLIGGVLAICVGFPLVLLGVERTIRALSPRAATTFYGVVVALLSAAVVMPWFLRGQHLAFPWNAVTSAGIGLAVAFAFVRTRMIRQFLVALAPAALVVPVLFLLDPGVKQSFLRSESAAAVEGFERTPPIVLVVFDELPMNSLLDAGGNIDVERYPNFGAFARDAHWFRNASTVAYITTYAVPAIVSGRYAIDKAVPTLRHYPVNLFTTLARRYEIFASMRFQQLCPPRACRQNAAMPGDSVPSLLSDLGLVWLHIVLPEQLTEELPPVVGEWAEFGRARAAPIGRRTQGRGAVFAQFLSSIDDRSARLHFLHLVLPHMPFEYVPSGRRYRGPDYQTTMYRGIGLFQGVSAAYADTLHQRHLSQVGFADRLVGDLAGRLREVGAYDKALIIITADHGASYRENRERRQPRTRQQNLSDIMQVPLFIKLPGQKRGEVVDRFAETVDILPTILDVVGARASLRFDGRSLIDPTVPERSRTFYLHNRVNRPPLAVGDLSADRAASLERKAHRFGSGDLMALYAPRDARHLLGTSVNRSGLRAAKDVHIAVNNPAQFEAVDRSSDLLPIYVRGVLTTSRPDPLNVAVVVNGVVTAIAHSYKQSGAHVFGTLIPETALRDGRNTVDAFVFDPPPSNVH